MPHVDATLYNALLQSRQGAMTDLTGGHRVYPQCGCCISGNTVGVYKDPVAILTVSDQDVCTFEPLSVSFSNSFSASSTLQTYAVDWGDGNNSNGAWPPPASIAHPAGGYTLPGNYVIILTITDLLGATGSTAVDVYAADCWAPMGFVPGEPVPDFGASGVWVYCTSANDVDDYYTADITQDPPAWTKITQADSIDKTCMCYRNSGTNRFFGYGDEGIWEYQNLPLGSGAWVKIMDEDDIADECGHLADYWQVTVFRMQFDNDPNHEEWAWAGVIIYWDDPPGTEHYGIWVLHSRDAWSHVQFVTKLFELEDGVDWDWLSACELKENGLAVDMHADYVYVICGKAPSQDGFNNPLYDGWWRLYRSIDYGWHFTLIQEQTYTWGVDGYEHADYSSGMCDAWVPWVDDEYNGCTLFWTAGMLDLSNNAWAIELDKLVYRTQNCGLSYELIGDDIGLEQLDQGLMFLKGPYNSAERVWGGLCMLFGKPADQTKIWTWRDGYAWHEWRDSNLATWRNCYNMLVMAQTGYSLVSTLCYEDPYYILTGSEISKLCTEEKITWFTVVVQ